ncbi:MAG: tripartite tricarboxylate transporter TctB family protein [Bacteroidota bacterium]|nr:tripartite tricarboxylate transporter TctB family protein [Bacteroidota bacterium]
MSARNIPGLAIILLAGLVWISSRQFPTLPEGYPGPALFPRVIAVLLLLAGARFLGQRTAGSASSDPFSWTSLARLGGGLGAIGVFLLVLPQAGAGWAAGGACLIMAAIQRIGWKQALVASTVTGLVAHLMFTSLLGL